MMGNKKTTDSSESMEYKHHYINIDGCRVKMNFPVESNETVMKDIARLMLGIMMKEQ